MPKGKFPLCALLILTLLFEVCGETLLFRYYRGNIRASIRGQIEKGTYDKKDLRRFALSVSQNEVESLDWHNDHEFRLYGKMFDIVSRETKGDTLYLNCLVDKKETELIVAYENGIGSDHENDKNAIKRSKTDFSFYTFWSEPKSLKKPVTNSQNRKGQYHFSVISWVADPVKPPPKA